MAVAYYGSGSDSMDETEMYTTGVDSIGDGSYHGELLLKGIDTIVEEDSKVADNPHSLE